MKGDHMTDEITKLCSKLTEQVEQHIHAEVRKRVLGSLDGLKPHAKLVALDDISKARARIERAAGKQFNRSLDKRARRRCGGCGSLKHDLRNCDNKGKGKAPKVKKGMKGWKEELAKLTPKAA